MSFLAPIAGLVAGAIGSGLVLLMYMLKLRRRPALVSSTLLWKRAVKDLEGNIPWQRLSPTMLLFLHLLIVALLALAIARPVFDSGIRDGQRIAIVIDTSASMGAAQGDRTLLGLAKREADRRVRGLFDSGRAPSVSVIDAGMNPRIVLLNATERGRVLGAIDAIDGRDQPGDVAGAIDLLERLVPEPGDEESDEDARSTVWLLSDGGSIEQDTIAMRGGSGGLIPLAQAAGLSNMGIVALSAQRDRVETELTRVFVRVIRSVNGPRAGVLRLLDGDTLIDTAPVAFEGDEASATHTFELRLMRAALLRVELGARDALASDDRAWVGVPSPEPIAVTVVAPDGVADPLLVDSLEVIARTSVRVIDADGAIGMPDLVVYDRVDAPRLPSMPSVGFGSVTPGLGDRVERDRGLRRVLSWERNDPILRDTGIGAMSYVPSIEFGESGGNERVLARDQAGAVMIEKVEGGVRHIRFGFALHDSDWSVQFGFTVLLAQICEQLLPGAGGSGEVYRTSEVIAYLDEAGVERSAGPYDRVGLVTLPDGREIGVSLLDAGESSLRVRESLQIGDGQGAPGVPGFGGGRVDVWRWFVAAAIVLLVIEWAIYLRRVRIAS